MDFIKSGAQIITANTYAVLQYLLQYSDNDIQKSVHRAVEIARIAKPDFVAGSLSAHGFRGFDHKDIRKSLFLTASALSSAPVDCILVEMIQNVAIAHDMIAAASTCCRPLLLGFSVREECNKIKFKADDVEFTQDSVSRLLSNACNVKVVGIMHTNIQLVERGLTVLNDVWSGPLMLYPDCGDFKDNVWHNENCHYESIVEDIINIAAKYPRLQIAGGCCGLGPEFTKLLRDKTEFVHAGTLLG